jgi:hypothetical protein
VSGLFWLRRRLLRSVWTCVQSLVVALQTVEAAHLRVTCDACCTATAEACGKRDLPTAARVAAVRKFQAVGWHHDPRISDRARVVEQTQRDGGGKWYCPTCAAKTDL